MTKVHLPMTFRAPTGSASTAPLGARTGFRAVLFDVDGTLYRQRPLRVLMALELATLPLTSPRAAVRQMVALRAFRAAQEDLRSRYENVAATNPARAQAEAAAAASGLSVAKVEKLAGEWMNHRPLKYLRLCRASGVMGLLDTMAQAGVRAGVLSDYPAAAKLDALGLAGRFAPVLTASDASIGAFKPSPRGYLRACEIWNLRPDEVLVVGDRADVDAEGAEAAGMPCVIVGRSKAPPQASYTVVRSLEQLIRVFDDHF